MKPCSTMNLGNYPSTIWPTDSGPFVVLGNVGARLKSGGRYLQYPDYGSDGHRTINTLYNTFLHATGKPRNDFGVLDPNLDEHTHRGPLEALLS